MRRIILVVALLAGLGLPAPGSAQGGPGFLFNRPRVSIGFRTGYALPRISSQIFDDQRQHLNLNRFDFDSPYLGGEVAVRANERFDVAFGIGWSESETRSHYRNFVEVIGTDTLEIEQGTRFQNAMATLGARYYFVDRGRTIGRFAWVPSRFTPFVSAGGGVAWYELEQVGDFVDVDTGDIITTDLQSDGIGGALYGGVGADVSIGKQFYLSGEARYTLANAEADGEYSDYDGVDLSGLQVIAGISIRF